MAQAKIDALNIYINGVLSPSLLQAINRAEAQLRAFGVSQKTQAAAMSRVYNQAFGSMAQYTDRLHDSIGSIFEISGGVALGEFMTRGWEEAIHLIGEATEKLKEFVKGSLEVKAERESLQFQQASFLRSKGLSGIGPDIEKMERYMPGRETMMPYDKIIRTSNLLMNAAPERFGNVDALHKMLMQLSDVSRDTQSFDLATQALTRILAEGKVDARHINEMGIDTGYAFKQAMAKALQVTPDELTEMIAKHKLTGKATIDALLKAFEIITGPGGEAYRHTEAQLSGLKGIWTRLLSDWGDFQESFGTQMENFIRPISQIWLPIFENMNLFKIFDGMSEWMTNLGVMIATLDFSKEIPILKLMGDELGNFFKKLTGGFDPTKMLKEVHGLYTDYGSKKFYETTPAYDEWHKATFGWMDSVLERLKQIGERIDSIVSRIGPLLTVIGAIINFLGWIDDILYGKIVPFLWDKMIGAFDELAKRLHTMFPWMVGETIPLPPSMTDLSSTPGGNRFNTGGHVESDSERKAMQEQVKENTFNTFSEIQKTNDLLYDIGQAFWTTGPNIGGNFGLHGDVSSGGSLQGLTYYGPGQPGDNIPHKGTWDSDSYNNIGHIHGKAYSLSGGDAAMKPLFAEGHYHIKPGDWYISDKDHKWHRWRDTSGAKNDENEDIFVDRPGAKPGPQHGASINITNHIYAMDSHGVERVLREHGETIADHVRRVWGDQDSRSAVV